MAPRRLRLAADYHCSPLWDVDDPDNVDPEDLPLPDDLRARLWAWAETFDAILNHDDPAASAFPSGAAEERFVEEGAALAEAVRAALGPGWEVQYFGRPSPHRGEGG